jgi:hypothetical protein
MDTVSFLTRELLPEIPKDIIICDEKEEKNFKLFCRIKKRNGEIFLTAKKVINVTDQSCLTEWEIDDKKLENFL